MEYALAICYAWSAIGLLLALFLHPIAGRLPLLSLLSALVWPLAIPWLAWLHFQRLRDGPDRLPP